MPAFRLDLPKKQCHAIRGENEDNAKLTDNNEDNTEVFVPLVLSRATLDPVISLQITRAGIWKLITLKHVE